MPDPFNEFPMLRLNCALKSLGATEPLVQYFLHRVEPASAKELATIIHQKLSDVLKADRSPVRPELGKALAELIQSAMWILQRGADRDIHEAVSVVFDRACEVADAGAYLGMQIKCARLAGSKEGMWKNVGLAMAEEYFRSFARICGGGREGGGVENTDTLENNGLQANTEDFGSPDMESAGRIDDRAFGQESQQYFERRVDAQDSGFYDSNVADGVDFGLIENAIRQNSTTGETGHLEIPDATTMDSRGSAGLGWGFADTEETGNPRTFTDNTINLVLRDNREYPTAGETGYSVMIDPNTMNPEGLYSTAGETAYSEMLDPNTMNTEALVGVYPDYSTTGETGQSETVSANTPSSGVRSAVKRKYSDTGETGYRQIVGADIGRCSITGFPEMSDMGTMDDGVFDGVNHGYFTAEKTGYPEMVDTETMNAGYLGNTAIESQFINGPDTMNEGLGQVAIGSKSIGDPIANMSNRHASIRPMFMGPPDDTNDRALGIGLHFMETPYKTNDRGPGNGALGSWVLVAPGKADAGEGSYEQLMADIKEAEDKMNIMATRFMKLAAETDSRRLGNDDIGSRVVDSRNKLNSGELGIGAIDSRLMEAPDETNAWGGHRTTLLPEYEQAIKMIESGSIWDHGTVTTDMEAAGTRTGHNSIGPINMEAEKNWNTFGDVDHLNGILPFYMEDSPMIESGGIWDHGIDSTNMEAAGTGIGDGAIGPLKMKAPENMAFKAGYQINFPSPCNKATPMMEAAGTVGEDSNIDNILDGKAMATNPLSRSARRNGVIYQWIPAETPVGRPDIGARYVNGANRMSGRCGKA